MTATRLARALGLGGRRSLEQEASPVRPKRGKGRVPREKPPNVIGRGPLLGSRGFGVALVCIVKDEAAYLEEWLAYHLALGVDHVFVYDNGSTDGSAAVLERYQNHGLVTRLDWPLGGGQLAAYNHALRFFGAMADWLAYHDVDEFLVPLLDDDIPSLLGRFPDAAVVQVPRREFGYSGHRSPPDGLTIDAYTQVADVLALDPALPPRVKSIVRPVSVNAVDVHLAFAADVPTPGTPSHTITEAVHGLAQLNHYYTRSFEEFEAKRVRGSATGRIERPAVPFELPTLATDTSAQRFSARTRETLERLRRLEPRPYMYGSDLHLEWFPRPNDLGRFAEFAIANMAAGLPEPARAPVRHLRNLHAGVGLVADLGAAPYQPAPGDLSASVHTGVLVAHMRGHIEASLASPAGASAARARTGRLDLPPGGPAELHLEDGLAEIVVELAASEMLRCWSVGFLLACGASLALELAVEVGEGNGGEDASAEAAVQSPVPLDLPASGCLAGVVEVAAAPCSARSLRVRIRSDAASVLIHDLFAISNG